VSTEDDSHRKEKRRRCPKGTKMGSDSQPVSPTRLLLNHSPFPPPPSIVSLAQTEDSDIKKVGVPLISPHSCNVK